MASGVRSSRCLSSLICFHVFPALASGLSILGGVIWLSGVSLYMSSFMCLPLWLVVSGCPDVFFLLLLDCHHFPYHFSPDSSVSQLMCLQSSVCLTMVVSDSFLIFHTLFPISFVSPLVCFPCGGIAISFMIGSFAALCSHCIFLLSQQLHQHRPQIAIRWKRFLMIYAVFICNWLIIPPLTSNRCRKSP